MRLLMMIFFLRFSGEQNVTFVFTPLSFGFSVPTLLPIGSGLLCNAFSALPAGCGVIIYYFIRFIRVQHKLLENPDVAIADKLKLLTDGIVQNWGMWITVIAFIAVILLVNLIRTRSFDYAWRIAIIAGGVVYVLMIIAGGFYFRLDIDVVTLIIYTVISVVIGLLLEFFVFGGDYTRKIKLLRRNLHFLKRVCNIHLTEENLWKNLESLKNGWFLWECRRMIMIMWKNPWMN